MKLLKNLAIFLAAIVILVCLKTPGHVFAAVDAFGCLDAPANNSTVKGQLPVNGWFLDAQGVSKIDVLVDGSVVGQAVYGLARTDVQNVYPNFNNGKAGFQFTLDTAKYKDGPHSLTIMETSVNGRTATLPASTIIISNVRGYLELPVSGTTLNGTKMVSGWFLDEGGGASIDVLVDGVVAGQATYGDDRPDVQKAFPDFSNGGKSGFHFALDTSKFTDGQHTVTVRETNASGRVSILNPSTITISNVRGNLEEPVSGTTLGGTKMVSGWFLDGGGVASIDVLVDGVVAGQATYGDDRPDVQKAYPGYSVGAKAGFHFALDTSKYTDGQHTVTVRETNLSGREMTLGSSKITIANVRGYVESPISGSTMIGTKIVGGWLLDEGGIASIDVLVDDVVAGQAILGDDRLDVQRAYPSYTNAGKSGFHFALDTTKFKDGLHKVSIRETGTSGRVMTLPAGTITITNVLGGYMENPAPGAILTGIKNISGWFVDEGSTTSTIDVLVDGNVVGQATYGDSRPDVKNVFPKYSNAVNSGFHFSLNTTQFTDGPHRITIRETTANGQVTALPDSTVTFRNFVGYVDNPLPGTVMKGIKNVSGWVLDASGVSTIDILVDGTPVGQATIGDARADVKNAFPDFNNGNAGFHYTLDTTQFSTGQHQLTIKETGGNGRVNILFDRTLTFNQSSKIVFLDPGHGGGDSGAVGGGYKESNLNLAVAKKVQALLATRGYTVYMSRTTDTFVELLDRSKMANDLHADIFVSIHTNALGTGETAATGIESYYYQYDPAYPSKINAGNDINPDRINKSIALAQIINTKMVAYTGAADRGIKGDTLSVVRESAMPATLLEMGFINNSSDRLKLISDSYQNALASAIADGIDVYFMTY